MKDRPIRDIFKSCFQIGYWLGKAGASDDSDDYLRQRELTIDSCWARLVKILELEEEQEKDHGERLP